MKAKAKVKDIFSPKKKEGGVVIMIGKPSKMKGKEMEDDEDDKCEKCGKKGCKMKCGGKAKMQDGGKVDKKKEPKEVKAAYINITSAIPYKIKSDGKGNVKTERATERIGGLKRIHGVESTSMDTTGFAKGKRKLFTEYQNEKNFGTEAKILGASNNKTSKILNREEVAKKLKKMEEDKKRYSSISKDSKMAKGGKIKKC